MNSTSSTTISLLLFVVGILLAALGLAIFLLFLGAIHYQENPRTWYEILFDLVSNLLLLAAVVAAFGSAFYSHKNYLMELKQQQPILHIGQTQFFSDGKFLMDVTNIGKHTASDTSLDCLILQPSGTNGAKMKCIDEPGHDYVAPNATYQLGIVLHDDTTALEQQFNLNVHFYMYLVLSFEDAVTLHQDCQSQLYEVLFSGGQMNRIPLRHAKAILETLEDVVTRSSQHVTSNRLKTKLHSDRAKAKR